ncbi:ARA1, partial [Linum perenne]
SAAVKRAVSCSVAAAHGLSISPRDIVLLCQKFFHSLVGAPCGVMDQMTSACGEANKLLVMVCQHAEVIGLVKIPNHIRFWGIDFGIRHSVGVADYGSVRIGAFMGRKIIKSITYDVLSKSVDYSNGFIHDELEDDGVALFDVESSQDYLCHLTPHMSVTFYRIKGHSDFETKQFSIVLLVWAPNST